MHISPDRISKCMSILLLVTCLTNNSNDTHFHPHVWQLRGKHFPFDDTIMKIFIRFSQLIPATRPSKWRHHEDNSIWSKCKRTLINQATGNCERGYMLQYIPRNFHTVFALLCFVVVIHWLIFPYPSGLLHWHCGNLTIAPVPAKQPWWIWINTSCEFIMNDCITTTKQSTTKPCAYFLGYTVRTTNCV